MTITAGVTLNLTHDEALVLFEWLSREEDALRTTHHAERMVLWKIEGQLERTLVEPLQPDYGAIIAAAQERITSGQ